MQDINYDFFFFIYYYSHALSRSYNDRTWNENKKRYVSIIDKIKRERERNRAGVSRITSCIRRIEKFVESTWDLDAQKQPWSHNTSMNEVSRLARGVRYTMAKKGETRGGIAGVTVLSWR